MKETAVYTRLWNNITKYFLVYHNIIGINVLIKDSLYVQRTSAEERKPPDKLRVVLPWILTLWTRRFWTKDINTTFYRMQREGYKNILGV